MIKKVLKVLIIVSIIITLTMANFIAIGVNMVSYAEDILTQEVKTNHKNVEFSAYFKNEKGDKLKSTEKTINNEDTKLFIDVEVKQEGYFNGEISLDSGNFNIKNEKLSEGIEKIENNKITLNQINAGQKVTIELGIEPIKSDAYDLSLLDMKSKISLNGTYKDSTQKDIKIQATRELELDLVSPFNNETDGIESNYAILTNENTKYNNEDKRVVQLSIKSGIKDNVYPIKNTKIEISVPELEEKLPTEVLVSSKGTIATNGDSEYNLPENAWKYDEKTKTITINVENKANNNIISWAKSGQDEYILTLIYDNTKAVLNEKNININSEITLYDTKGTTLKKVAELQAEETKDYGEIIGVTSSQSEGSIYKGKMYSQIQRDITSTTKIDVTLDKVAEDLYIVDKTETMVRNPQNAEQLLSYTNIDYKQTVFNKNQLIKILGEDFNITIINPKDNSQIAKVTKESKTDANGNIIVTYPENTQSIGIKTNKPEKVGKIEFVNTKTIKSTTANITKLAEQIVTTVEGTYKVNGQDTKIEASTSAIKLEEPQTSAKIEISRKNLSTVLENRGVEIKAILESNKESNDLYKNPTIRIELPSQIQEINVNSIKLLYEDELKISDAKLTTENGKKVINIKLAGEQTNYKDIAIEGSTIIINANLKLDRKTTSSDEAVTLTYTNEKATSYKENKEIGTESTPVSIVSPKGLITVNNIDNLGVETIGDTTEKNVMLEKGKDAKTVKVETEIINNNDSGISNVAVLGTFPTKESKIDNKKSNIETKIASNVAVEGADAKVYYSENENATAVLADSTNAWKENIENNQNVKKYLIVVNNMDNAQTVKASYDVEIPQNLEYNEEAYTGYTVDYTNTTTGLQQNAKSTTISTQTGVGPVIESSLTATVGNDNLQNGSEVKTGEVIRYNVTVKNTGTEEAQNVKISGQVPEGTVYVEPEENYEYTGASYYKETEKQTHDIEVGTIKAGETVTKTYEVRVKTDTADGKEISSKVTTYYGEAKQETNEIKNTVKSGNLRVTVKRVTDRKNELITGNTVQYYAIIENISNKTQENVKLHTNLPENVEEPTLEKITGLKRFTVTKDSEESEEIKIDGEDNSQAEEIEYAEDLNIGNINAGENIVIAYTFNINKEIEAMGKDIQFSTTAKDSSDLSYRSNVRTDLINNIKIEASMSSIQDSKTLKTWDKLDYVIKIKNLSNIEASVIELTDALPEQLNLLSITQDGEKVEIEEGQKEVYINTSIPANGETTINVQTEVGSSLDRASPEVITNKADVLLNGEHIQSTSEISNVIEPAVEDNSSDNNNNNNGNNGNNGNNNNNGQNNNGQETSNHVISGTAWLDENSDGKKDSGEQLLSGINVKLLNVETNELAKNSTGKLITATTSNNGTYVLQNVATGKYIVIFEYDTSKYGITSYQKEGLAQSENSNAVLGKLNIDGKEKTYGITDTIDIENTSVTGINLGLTELKNFDIQLDKYINKITVQDNKGTSSYSYEQSKLAKVELPAKQINGAMVIVEYGIKVTNCGEVDAYASKIVDYMSDEFKFSSELNKDWYQADGNLYNSSLANEKIPAGESRELKLVLTKQMTEDNTGLVNNTAEIAEQYNESGFEDTNSTPKNKKQGENDMSSADIIISVKTGAVTYIALTIIIIAIIGLGVYIINKKVLRKNK